MIEITVTGGTGAVTSNSGFRKCEAVSIISPDNTPMYDFDIHNGNGAFLIGATGIEAQKAKIVEPFQLDGPCLYTISNAVDDGIYYVQIFEK